MKTFIEEIKRGFGFALGILLVFTALFVVYGFVEPTSPPSNNYFLDSNSILSEINSSNQGLRWAGYTSSTYTGQISGSGDWGTQGFNNKCHQAFSGSRAMTYDDLIKLGNDYPYTNNAWVIDGGYTSSSRQNTKDGQTEDSTNNPIRPNCAGWTTSSTSYRGVIIYTNGYLNLQSCGTQHNIPCVYD